MKHTVRTSLRFLLAALAIVVILAFVVPRASAQFYPGTVTVTNVMAATTTNSVTASVIEVDRYDQFSLQITGKLTGAGTSAVTYTVSASVDGSNYIEQFKLPLTAAGTTTVSAMTNVNAGSIPYWKVTTLGNANANSWTNGVVTWGVKRSLLSKSPF
jgi:hypothetical protein